MYDDSSTLTMTLLETTRRVIALATTYSPKSTTVRDQAERRSTGNGPDT
jgi:hypothetical protein